MSEILVWICGSPASLTLFASVNFLGIWFFLVQKSVSIPVHPWLKWWPRRKPMASGAATGK
jgi:hypothetical protein